MNIIESIESLISNKIGEIKSIYTLIKLEAKLSVRSLSHLLLYGCLFFFIFIAFWLITMGLMIYGLHLLLGNLFYALGLVWVFNLVIILILLKCILSTTSRMSFRKTMDYFSNIESEKYESFDKTITIRNRPD